MREILLRGKRTINGDWVYGDFVHGNERKSLRDSIFVYDSETQSFNDYEINPSTLGQYTGLTDKNGKRIFEGDILGSRYDYLYPDNVAVEVVKWFCNSWVIQEGDHLPTMLEEDEIMPYSEVIGNVHDNKELWGGNEL